MSLVVAPFVIANEEQRLAALEHVERLLRRLSETANEIAALTEAIRKFEKGGQVAEIE